MIRCVEIIGEAAAKVSEATRSSAPGIPWAAMVGMRNRLVHAYFDVDTDVVWKTVTVELPVLKARLQALLWSARFAQGKSALENNCATGRSRKMRSDKAPAQQGSHAKFA